MRIIAWMRSIGFSFFPLLEEKIMCKWAFAEKLMFGSKMGGSDSGVGVKAGVDSFFDQLESESEPESTFFGQLESEPEFGVRSRVKASRVNP